LPAARVRPSIFLVTDPQYQDDHLVRVVREVGGSLPAGSFAVQLRDKARDRRSLQAFAERLRAETARCGAPFVVNGDVDLAIGVGADGVHLGGDAASLDVVRKTWTRMWISVAAHRDEDVRSAVDGGADAVLVSPIFETPGKMAPRGAAALERAAEIARGAQGHRPKEGRRGSRVVVYALGGVTRARARECRNAGADGVAVIRALLSSGDPKAEALGLWSELG
jgi:thiamine-phosphate pyrophosphorylase